MLPYKKFYLKLQILKEEESNDDLHLDCHSIFFKKKSNMIKIQNNT